MIPGGLRIFVATQPIDMRCSIDGLVAAVAESRARGLPESDDSAAKFDDEAIEDDVTAEPLDVDTLRQVWVSTRGGVFQTAE